MYTKNGIKLSYLFIWSFLFIFSFATAGCGSTPTQTKESAAPEKPDTNVKPAPTDALSDAPSGGPVNTKSIAETTETFSAAPEAILLTPIEILSTADRNTPEHAKDRPKEIIDSCLKKPYVQHEKQIKRGISDAWTATQAGKFGVGFRDKKEYTQWDTTQQGFFLYTSNACQTLALCELKNKQTKEKISCNAEKTLFTAWQNSAKLFAEKVNLLKNQQPPALCGLQPKNTDVSLCFKQLADQIDTACTGDTCQALSQCWRSVAMKDGVIRQAESSCRFSGQKPLNCRGYIDAIKRRKARFSDCDQMQKDINLTLQSG
jgi:hypothetical protein